MININFDKLLFVLSADALVRFALPGLDEISLEKIRDIARTEIDRFMDGGSNYYMEVDFSEGRKSETARDFLLAVRALKNGSLIADEISSLAASNAVATGGYHNARSKLRSIAARFCYLKTEDLLVIPTPYLQEIALNLEVHDLNPLYFDFSSTLQAIESAEPASPWDKRVLGPELFDGIDGVVRLAAKEMVEGGRQFVSCKDGETSSLQGNSLMSSNTLLKKLAQN